MKPFSAWVKKAITFQGIIRVLADMVMVNGALILSLAARLLWFVAAGNSTSNLSYRLLFWNYARVFLNNSWALTIICLVVFSLSGFYTYGRFYRGRYKALIVLQAVSLAYILFGFITFLAQSAILLGNLSELLNFPRGALLLAWALSALMLMAARGWATVWKGVIKSESARNRPESKKIQNILVIGGAGYIGSALLPKLLDAGYKVRLLDLLIYGTEPIEEWLKHPRLEVVKADFRQVEKVVQAMHGMDAVVHLGGLVGDPACALDEQLTIDINLMATRMIAEVAKGSGIAHFVFASTCSVYGESDQMLDERSELRPVSLYARSKIASEKVLLKMADDTFAPVILRFSTIYGFSGRSRFDLVVNLLTAKAIVDNEITVFGGDQWRPFLHVSDAALAILRVLKMPLNAVRNQTFNVGSNDQNFQIKQVAELIKQRVPSAEIINNDDITDKRNYWVNFNKINRTLGFVPEWTVERGIEQVIEALKSGKIKDYRDAKYSNIKFLKEQGLYLLTNNPSLWPLDLLKEETMGALLQDVA